MRDTSVREPEDAAAAPATAKRVTTARERQWAFVILFLSLTCLGMGQTVIFAILPPLSRKLGLLDFQVGAIFMVSAVFWLIMSPFWGRRSDVWGRKPVMLIGLGAFMISMAVFATLLTLGLQQALPLVVLYPALILSRIIFGTFGPGANSAAQAYVADRTTPEQRTGALAAIGAAFVLGTTMGPGMVWLLSDLGLLAPLYGVAALGGLSSLAIFFFLPERTGPTIRAPAPRMSFFDPRVREPLAICILMSSVQAVPIQTVTFLFMDRFADDAALAAELAAQALLASSVAMLIVQLAILPRLGWPEHRLMVVGAALSGVGFLLFALALGPGAVTLGMVFLGTGFGLARSGAVGAASLSVSPDEQGAVSGLVGATGGAGFIVAPLFAFPLYAYAPEAPFLLCLAIIIAVLGWLTLHRPNRRKA